MEPISTTMQDKVCLVTGATNGIGLVAARELARRGARVILVGRNPARCEASVAQIQAQTGNRAVEALRVCPISEFFHNCVCFRPLGDT